MENIKDLFSIAFVGSSKEEDIGLRPAKLMFTSQTFYTSETEIVGPIGLALRIIKKEYKKKLGIGIGS